MTLNLHRQALERRAVCLSQAVFALFFAHSVWAVSQGWHLSLLQQHSFRQTQTAISVFWMMRGGPLLAYDTPIFGPPWSLPLEFPLFQWIVALLVAVARTPLDQTGRFVSVSFFYLTLVPINAVIRRLGIPAVWRPLFLSAFLASPVYLYWSRAFLVESLGLFLSVSFLAMAAAWKQETRTRWLYGAAALGGLAAAVKITTFLPFLFLAGLLYVFHTGDNYLSAADKGAAIRRAMLPAMLLLLVPILAAMLWTSYADAVKSRNPLANFLLSSALHTWIYGTWEQRSSAAFWTEVWNRCLRDALGSSVIFAGFLFCVPFVKRRAALIAAAAGAYLISLLVFTNLHYIHNYYQYENGLLLIAVVALCATDLLEQGGRHRLAGGLLLAMMLAGSVYTYHKGPFLILQVSEDNTVRTSAEALRRRLKPDEVVLLDGLSYSPEIAYYSGRRAIMNRTPVLATSDLLQSVAALPPLALGAVGSCGPKKLDRSGMDRLVAMIDFRVVETVDAGTCVFYFGSGGSPPRQPKRTVAEVPQAPVGIAGDLMLTGVSVPEGPYPQWQLPVVRWGLGPKSTIRVSLKQSHGMRLVLKALSYTPGRSMRILVDGKESTRYVFASAGTIESISVPLRGPEPTVDLVYDSWDGPSGQDGRKRAILFTSIQIAGDDTTAHGSPR